MGNCKAVPVGVKGKLKSWNGHTVVARRRSKMLADVGMVKMYSKSVHVNDLGFAWTGPPPCCTDRLPPPPPPPPPPPCMDRPFSLFLQFFRQVVLPYLAGTHCTIPTSALVYGGIIYGMITYTMCILHIYVAVIIYNKVTSLPVPLQFTNTLFTHDVYERHIHNHPLLVCRKKGLCTECEP